MPSGDCTGLVCSKFCFYLKFLHACILSPFSKKINYHSSSKTTGGFKLSRKLFFYRSRYPLMKSSMKQATHGWMIIMARFHVATKKQL